MFGTSLPAYPEKEVYGIVGNIYWHQQFDDIFNSINQPRVPTNYRKRNSLTFPWLFPDQIKISLTQNIDICQALWVIYEYD